MSDSGSSSPTSKSTFRASLVTTAAPAKPIAEPSAISAAPRRTTSLVTSNRVAPSAMRMPTSRVRWQPHARVDGPGLPAHRRQQRFGVSARTTSLSC